jgi:N-acetylglucosamine kinase-like BadF-type ATPase
MSSYYLGADLGATKTHVLIATETGKAVGFGQGGPGNHEVVGVDGFSDTLHKAVRQALDMAGILVGQIAGAGFGIAGYDWPSQYEMVSTVVNSLSIQAPMELANDAVPGIAAAARDGWGIAVVSGTGCNCWGWDRSHTRIGHVTGCGLRFGEGGGASEMVEKSIQHVAYEYTRRGPATLLTRFYMERTGTKNIEDLLSSLIMGKVSLDASAAPLIFKAADQGDIVANDLITWAGGELGELVNCVVRQLDFQSRAFDVVMLGSTFNGGDRLVKPMKAKIKSLAPLANLVRFNNPPVVGGVLMGMQKSGLEVTQTIRARLNESIAHFIS